MGISVDYALRPLEAVTLPPQQLFSGFLLGIRNIGLAW